MMEELMSFIMPIFNNIVITIVAAIFGYIGIKLKNFRQNQVNDAEKEAVVRHTVEYIEQVFKDVHGQAKFDACLDKVGKILREKGIPFGKEEIKVLIESAVKSMNDAMKE